MKIIVAFFKKIDGEWYEKTRTFDNKDDAWEYMTSLENVWKFTVKISR